MDDYIRIATLENEIEGRLLGALLDGQCIPHAIQSFHDPVFDGIFQLQRGWGCVLGPRSKEAEILELLDQLRREAGEPAPPSPSTPDEP